MKPISAAIILFLIAAIPSCKKDNNAGVICNGNGTASYLPLAVGDSRHFTTGSVETYDTIITQSGDYYYQMFVEQGFAPSYDTLRVAGNGDVFDKNPYFPAEFLLVPGSPQAGQVWSYTDNNGNTYHKKVLNLHASTATTLCFYNNCMEVQDSLDNNHVEVIYYAPGIGPVQSITTAGPASSSELSGVVLK